MTAEQLLPLFLGPAGLTIGLLFALYKFQRGDWVARERLSEMREQRDKALELLDKATGGTTAMAQAIEERNRLERSRLDSRHGLSDELRATEEQIRRPTRRGNA